MDTDPSVKVAEATARHFNLKAISGRPIPLDKMRDGIK